MISFPDYWGASQDLFWEKGARAIEGPSPELVNAWETLARNLQNWHQKVLLSWLASCTSGLMLTHAWVHFFYEFVTELRAVGYFLLYLDILVLLIHCLPCTCKPPKATNSNQTHLRKRSKEILNLLQWLPLCIRCCIPVYHCNCAILGIELL